MLPGHTSASLGRNARQPVDRAPTRSASRCASFGVWMPITLKYRHSAVADTPDRADWPKARRRMPGASIRPAAARLRCSGVDPAQQGERSGASELVISRSGIPVRSAIMPPLRAAPSAASHRATSQSRSGNHYFTVVRIRQFGPTQRRTRAAAAPSAASRGRRCCSKARLAASAAGSIEAVSPRVHLACTQTIDIAAGFACDRTARSGARPMW